MVRVTLNNYLHHKPLNISNSLRAIYYFIYRELGLTNDWHYD
jgi:hypothetical protein